MIETHDSDLKVQANAVQADVRLTAMSRMTMDRTMDTKTAELVTGSEWRRTFVALVSASVISLVVWGLVVVLNVR
jgi:hypothetical protein